MAFLQAAIAFLLLTNAAAIVLALAAVRRMRAVDEIARACRVTETSLAPRSLEQRFRNACQRVRGGYTAEDGPQPSAPVTSSAVRR
jgi:hypothetical protein